MRGQLLTNRKIQIRMRLHRLKTRLTHGACVMIPADTFTPRASISVANDDPMRVFVSRLSDECAKEVR